MYAAIKRIMADPIPRPAKHAYTLARNLRVLAPIVEAQRDALKGDWMAPLEAFEREGQELVLKHAQRAIPTGNPIVSDGGMGTLADPEAFGVEYTELRGRHPD